MQNGPLIPSWLQVLGTLGSILLGMSAIGLVASQRKKNAGDAAEAVTQATLALLRPLEQRIKLLEARDHEKDAVIKEQDCRLQAQEREILRLSAGVDLLTQQVLALGQKPAWYK